MNNSSLSNRHFGRHFGQKLVKCRSWGNGWADISARRCRGYTRALTCTHIHAHARTYICDRIGIGLYLSSQALSWFSHLPLESAGRRGDVDERRRAGGDQKPVARAAGGHPNGNQSDLSSLQWTSREKQGRIRQ